MKYLIEIHHGIGDVVQITGVVDSIRQTDPQAYIALILNKNAYSALFQDDVRIQQIYRIDLRGQSKGEILKTVLALRKERFDYFILSPISNHKASCALAMMIGAKHSYGEQLGPLAKYSHKYVAIARTDEHIVKRNFNVLAGLGDAFKESLPRLCCRSPLPVEVPKHSIGLCIGTSIPQKTWPLENYIQVAKYFSAKGYNIVLLGGKAEALRYQEANGVHNQWINFLGELSLTGSAVATGACDLVLGGDTGVMHMAAAMGVPTLTLFSCTNPQYHAPYSTQSFYYNVDLPCQFCYATEQMRKCIKHRCLEEIDPDAISALAEKILTDNDFGAICKHRYSGADHIDS